MSVLKLHFYTVYYFLLVLFVSFYNIPKPGNSSRCRSLYIERRRSPRVIRNGIVCLEYRLDYTAGSATSSTVRLKRGEEEEEKDPIRSYNSSYVAHRKCFELSTDFSNFIPRALSSDRPVFFLSPPSEPPPFGASARITPGYMSLRGPIEFLLPSCIPPSAIHLRTLSENWRNFGRDSSYTHTHTHAYIRPHTHA